MGEGIKIDLGSCLPYLEEKFRKLIGKDEASTELSEWFKSLQTTAILQSEGVQCVGMRTPMPFDSIYQPTHLQLPVKAVDDPKSSFAKSQAVLDRTAQSIVAAKALEDRSITVTKFLQRNEPAVILAGPGWGKTTFLHYVFRSFIHNEAVLPVLITLRRQTAIEDLSRFVGVAEKIIKKQQRMILLLVDGYDEISVEQRHHVSDSLLRFQALDVGNFYLTCREYYEVFDLGATKVRIDRFDAGDKYRFVRAFLIAYQSPLDPGNVIGDLESRGFSEFLSHPLLLTLACILKTSSSTVQPRSALRLLERALDVLCYQWDEHKGIDRQQATSLDGRDRIQILMRIAFISSSPFITQQRVEGATRKVLDRMSFDKVDPRSALMETAKFYGILVPTDDGWEFVHRTIHDFLAAKYWVETGEFAKLTAYEWNARTAYAACLMDDSTHILEVALAAPDGLPTVTEIISNAPSFDPKRVARAIMSYYTEGDRVQLFDKSDPDRVTGRLKTDFVRRASSRFLNGLFELCCAERGMIRDIIAAYCALELYERRLALDTSTYAAAVATYRSERFTFAVPAEGQVQLQFLKPPPEDSKPPITV